MFAEAPPKISTAHRVESQTKSKAPPHVKRSDLEIKLTASDKELLKKLDMEHREKLKSAAASATATTTSAKVQNGDVKSIESKKVLKEQEVKKETSQKEKSKVKAVPHPKARQSVSIHYFLAALVI